MRSLELCRVEEDIHTAGRQGSLQVEASQYTFECEVQGYLVGRGGPVSRMCRAPPQLREGKS